ncbi:MAG TPA: sulfatase-like hydrolase/transferase [Candidatus Saccharimonadales bacterium]|nr:sulfatase-like hydrolase/transferase [Candidatus Saccharimonadales bacterium]
MKLSTLQSCVLLLAAGSLSVSCGGGGAPVCEPALPVHGSAATPEGSLWTDSVRDTVNLTSCPAEILGNPPGQSGPLARWSGPELDAWQKTVAGDRVRISSPPVPEAASTAVRLLVVLTPGGAHQVQIVPFVKAAQSDPEQRRNRSVMVGLERDAGPDDPVTILVDLTEEVRGSWGDAVSAQRRLDRIEIALPGADPDRVHLRQVVLASDETAYEDAAAAVRRVTAGGIIRPAWYANAGDAIRIRVRAPRYDPELRWNDAALPGTGPRVIRLLGGERPQTLWRSDTKILHHEKGWHAAQVDLRRWADQAITLEFAVESQADSGKGVGFFGDPRLVSASGVAPAGILLYMIDDLRADRVDATGADGTEVMPELHRLAASGVSFGNALTSSPWTKPALPTLLTGIWPTTHQVGSTSYSDRLPGTVTMIQERFRDAGWRTGSFSASPLGSTLSGLDRGFATAAPPRRWKGDVGALMHPSADQLSDALMTWLGEEPGQPFFAFVHTLEVHSYRTAVYQGESDASRPAAYDRAAHDVDRALGALLAKLAGAGRDARLLVVVVADHGESFGDHGYHGHGSSLYEAQLHIPLVFSGQAISDRGAFRPGLVIGTPVSLADVAPTLADLAGLPRLPEAGGRSLADYIRRGADAEPPDRPFVPSALLRFVLNPAAPRQHALVTPDLRKILRIDGEDDLVFDLRQDPEESSPIPGGDPALSRMLDRWIEDQRRAAEDFSRRHGGTAPGALDADEAERLRSLGYLQ